MRTWNKWLIGGVAVALVGIGVAPSFADVEPEERPSVARHRPVPGSCADPAMLFCEDFDALPTGEAASPDWEVDLEKGTLTVEQVMPAEGRKSTNQVLHARTDDNGRARLVVTDLRRPARRRAASSSGRSAGSSSRSRAPRVRTGWASAPTAGPPGTGPTTGSRHPRPRADTSVSSGRWRPRTTGSWSGSTASRTPSCTERIGC